MGEWIWKMNVNMKNPNSKFPENTQPSLPPSLPPSPPSLSPRLPSLPSLPTPNMSRVMGKKTKAGTQRRARGRKHAKTAASTMDLFWVRKA